ncbi:uncharacterized protein LOC118202642 [Stegodyphus dumicola]|uniref:uncharacterized protein LOC118202642 n=1 Tax=Stegodyphus dumicola TaxID=202533 RepID=UPI0015AD2D22|nr:uncharacterized protein LOC118202642 [Stegodyphus dumicola]
MSAIDLKSEYHQVKMYPRDKDKTAFVTCYSDQHVEECRLKIVKLEKEFKAFVRKLKQLTPGTLHSIPWTNRPYKRKKADVVNATPNKEFVPIPTPILEGEKPKEQQFHIQNLPSMDKPLYFVTNNTNVCKNVVETCKLSSVNCKNIVDDYELSSGNCSIVLDTCQPAENCKDIKNTSTLSSAASVNDSSEEIKTQEISVSNNCEKERCNKNSVESPCKQIPSLVDYDFLSDSEEDL